MSSEILINASSGETRVALLESDVLVELYVERNSEQGITGNIYKGRVVRVLPGMQAAFVDIGLEKAAFLYVGDVTGDPDFSEEFELTEGEHAAGVSDVPSEQEAEEQEVKAKAASEAPPLETPALTPMPGQLAALTPPPIPGLGAPAVEPPFLAPVEPAPVPAEAAAPAPAAPAADEAAAPAAMTPILLTQPVEEPVGAPPA